MKRALLAAAFALLPLSVAADNAPTAPVQDWSNQIETVVVTPGDGGPLMWHVTKGDSELYLLGVVGPLPKDLQWQTHGVETALKGATQLLLPPTASVGLFEGLWFLMWNRDALYLPDSTPMESTISAPLRTRFTATRERLHRDADRYSDLRVPLAALRLEGDFQNAQGFDYRALTKTIERLASHAGVHSKAIASYETLPIVKQLPGMSAAANEACMKAALDDIDAQSVHARPAAEAWAVGDLDGIKANYSEDRFESCIQSMPSFAALFTRAVNDSAAAANAALNKKGKSVMVVSIGVLLRKGGILDRLTAEGLTVDAPSNRGS